jgi:cytochrome d ubiquinol oxidase subunit II
MSTLAATVLWFGITWYVVFGGADYGAGFWDLTAGGAKRGARPRALIDQAMGPVWEANNVWLIFALVVLWTAFPPAFAAIMSTLFVPMSLAAAGIVLRGSAFVFRKPIHHLTKRRLLGATFAMSSVVTPFFLGTVFGAIASGRVKAGDLGGDPVSAWIAPTPILIGVLAVLCSAFTAAVFLVFDARRARDEELVHYFRRRAIGTAGVTGLIAVVGLFVLRSDAPFVFHGLVHEGLPFVLLSGACGIGVIVLLAKRITLGTRGLAVAAVVTLLAGWGVAQYPYLLPTSLTITAGAGAPGTLTWVLVVLLIALVTVVPALLLLFVLDQRDRLLDRDHRLGSHPR